MKILGMEIPNEVAEAIVAKAKTEELFKEYFEDMKWRWKNLEKDKHICSVVESLKGNYPGCKIVFKIKYDADGYFEMEHSGYPNDNGVLEIIVAYDYNTCSLRQIHEKLFAHIKKTYQIDFEEYYPTLHLEEHSIDIKCKKSQHLNDLITDIKERIPEVTVKCMKGNVIRIKMK